MRNLYKQTYFILNSAFSFIHCSEVFSFRYLPPARFRHSIEINQKSDSRQNLSPFSSMRMSKIRHFDAILASSPGTFHLYATFAGYEG